MRPTLLLLLLALPTIAGDPAAPAERDSFTFVVFGDRTGGSPDGVKVLLMAVDATNRLDPDLVMTVGDLVQGYSAKRPWLDQMKEYKEIMSGLRRPWYPVAGNHDVYGGRSNPEGNEELFKKHFGPLYYSFDYKWAHFVVLYSDENLGRGQKAQHMSAEQIAWLEKDLAATGATQVYVFLHHPRWTYSGTNWPDVHRVLAKDGRVKAVFGGHIHVYRDDGLRDGVHYYTLAVTGGRAGGLKTPASLHHLNHLKVTRSGFSMSVHPVGGVLGANMVLGAEVDKLYALRRGDWLALEGGAVWDLDGPRRSQVTVKVTNPAETPVAYELRFQPPRGWTAEPAFVGGQMRAGETKEQTFDLAAPPFRGGPARAFVHTTLHHPLESGLVHPVHHRRTIPVRIVGLPTACGDENRVLVTDSGRSVRVDLPPLGEVFTLECWARGEEPFAAQAVVSKTETSGYGIWWCWKDRRIPYGIISYPKGGYRNLAAKKPWKWEKWTHLALACSDTDVRFFVDGKLQHTEKRAGPRRRNNRPLFIGADPNRRDRPSYFFVGAIDEVRLSDVARYEADFEPARHHERDGNTLLLLHFDQQVHGVFPDDSGHDHHGWPVGKAGLVAEKR